mgnify:CR=1 FL=1
MNDGGSLYKLISDSVSAVRAWEEKNPEGISKVRSGVVKDLRELIELFDADFIYLTSAYHNVFCLNDLYKERHPSREPPISREEMDSMRSNWDAFVKCFCKVC